MITNTCIFSVIVVCTGTLFNCATAFTPLSQLECRLKLPSSRSSTATNIYLHPEKQERISSLRLLSNKNDDDGDDENPYADENYPELEFVNYDDPDYIVDQGVSDEFSSNDDDTEVEIEKMREERRRKNDEFQFQTYYASILKNGDEYKGEWTIYKTNTFIDGMESNADENGAPRLVKINHPLRVISKGYKTFVESDSEFSIDKERICHEEKSVNDEESSNDSSEKADEEFKISSYCPDEMTSLDFRGEQGNMIVGNAYTTCTSLPLDKDSSPDKLLGPFSEHRVELGLQSKQLQFRIKLDYSTKDADKDAATPPALYLKSVAICREALSMWPPQEGKYQTSEDREIANSLSGLPGAEGGLYDAPLVGSDEQATRYMMLDLEGRATLLFPYMMDQDPKAFDGNGWVTTLDWAPDGQRYQVDRKVKGGADLMYLRTLELSEVQSASAQQYRPRDGGSDMRQ